MFDNEEILYTETKNYKFRKDSPENYYDIGVVNDNLDKIDKTIKDVKDKNTNVQSDWNIADTKSDAFIKNKPASLPADGGTADTIKNTLPINKGGTGATSVVNALKNLNLLNHNISNVPSCTPLVYKNYTDFGINSMSIHNFIRQMPEHSFFVFENNKNASAYINDAPYTIGVIYAFRGYVHDGHALFFSSQKDNGSIYHFLCNRDVILQNWTKVNDNGNADTVDGKHAADFAPSGFGLGTSCKYVTGDWNDYIDTGFYSGNNLINQPWQITNSSLFCYMLVIKHDSTWVMQMAFQFNSPKEVYIRNKTGQTWTSWQKITDGGNADTVDGKHAADFAPSGYGLGGYSQAVGTDWNNYTATGFYHGRNLPNQPPTPDGTNGLWYVLAIKYTDERWCVQIAFNFVEIDLNYIRKKINNTWSQWTKINDGGNALTLNGKQLSDLIQKYGVILNKDANDIRTSGEYYFQGGTNVPDSPVGHYGWLKVEEGYNVNYLKQIYTPINGTSYVYQRFLVNGVWNNWTKIGDSCNALTLNNHEDSYFATAAQITTANTALNNKVDKVSGKGLSTNDFTAAYKTKLDGIATGAKANVQSDWNVTATNSDAFIKNKPTSLPANGGNADTVDGKHAEDFVQTYMVLYEVNADDVKTSGEYFIEGGIGFPFEQGWLKVEVPYKSKTYIKQTFTSAYSREPYTYQRITTLYSSWGVWTRLNDGGNADTVDGKHAEDFATAAQMTTVNTALNNKVDKVSGKGLSTNDFTAAYKTKLDGIANSAEANVQSDWNEKNTGSDAYIKNKPASLPANGGNADTVDGKHAADLQNYNNLTNKPTSLPANGGNADTVDGKHASEFSVGTNKYIEFEAEYDNWYRVAWSYIGRCNGVLAITLRTVRDDYNSFAVLAISLENNLKPDTTGKYNIDINVLSKNTSWEVMKKLRIVSGYIQGYGKGDYLDIFVKTNGKVVLEMSFLGSMFEPLKTIEKIDTVNTEDVKKEIEL